MIALAAIFASTQTLAGTSVDYDVPTTGDLITLCSVSADDSLYEAARGFCLGYIDAAMDYHAALTAGPSYEGHCLPAGGCLPRRGRGRGAGVVPVQWAAFEERGAGAWRDACAR